jgi:iduronate 2-sulfatase
VLVVSLSLGTACQLFSRKAAPPPVRGIVLVLASGLEPGGDPQRTPALRRLIATGRSFDAAFAPDSQPAIARQLSLGTQSHTLAGLFRARGAAVAFVGASDGLGEASDLRLPEGSAGAARLESWLRAQAGGFLVVAAIGERASVLPPPVPGLDRAPSLPRIAAGDLAFADRPGRRLQPDSWSASSKQRAEAEALERALAADRALEQLLALVARAAPQSAIVLVGDPPVDRGAHGILARPGLFDDSLRSTLVLAAPGLARPGRSSRRLVSTRDVLPTLLDLAGMGPEPGLPGRSLMPLVADPNGPGAEEVLSSTARQASRIGRSARSDRWRYTEWPDGSLELYDHETDPGENTNLAGQAGESGTLAELQRAFDTEGAAGVPPPAGGEAAAGGRAARPPETRAPRAERPRNVLFVILDDLNTRVGAWGAPVRTPSIDRLAARGVRFDRAYVPVAMCSPSRASLWSGWRPARTRVWTNVDSPRPAGSLPLEEHFAAHGVVTAAIGKITHFQEQFRWDVREEHPQLVEDEHEGVEGIGGGKLFEAAAGGDRDQPDGQRALRAVRLLERYRNRPFFLALGLVRPHRRWIAPARYFALYPPQAISLVPFPPDDLADVPAIAIKTKPQPLPGLPLLGREPPGLVTDPGVRREAIAAYQACTTFADAQVGLVLDALDRLDLWRSTVVVLIGDNGYHLGEHAGLLRKDTLFEEALHVPLIVAAPGLRPAVVRAPVELLDLYPTIVELAGLPPVAGLDARSLVPQLEHPETASRRPALSYRRVQPPERGWSLRTEHMRYTLWPDGSEELYDARDAGETRDLSARPEQAALKAALRARLTALVAGAGATPEQ